ncbi:hypothetical protein OS493_006456 [Desmophyllum pertusum]|uniref:Peptidase M48 domain-containing protein n=1 Tax=Desmophyllum pertusum TaxID=174260 RepID=A0A9X0A5D7_9CNID|nr:hypothetical protein OS493_006456 [Desmophyllum pertusum]
MEVAFEKLVRSIVRLGIGGLLLVGASGELFPRICKEWYGLKDENGVFVEVPDRCHKQFDEVAKKYFGLKNADEVTLFVNRDFYALSAGSTLLPGGAVLGVPRWYLYQTKEDVENSGIQLGKYINRDSEVGVAVTKSFLPTDDMIAFTIGHELAHIEHHLDFKTFFTFSPPLWLYLTYRVASSTRKCFRLPVVLDALVKLCIYGFNYQAYRLAGQKVRHLAEFSADEISAKCDPRMAQGGVDHFATTLKRNAIQRVVLGEKGLECYTEEGDDIRSTSISTHPPLTERLLRVTAICDAPQD